MDSGHWHHNFGIILNHVAVAFLGEWDRRGCVLIVGPPEEGTGKEVF